MAIAFYTLAALLLGSALMVVTSKNLVRSAVFLVLAFLSLAGLYVTLEAEFLAAVQVLVYAGGIMVLFLFAVMLVSFRNLEALPQYHRQTLMAVFLGALLFAAAGWLVGSAVFAGPGFAEAAPALHADGGNSGAIAMALFHRYLFPFELAGLFLFAAMLGAIILAKKDV